MCHISVTSASVFMKVAPVVKSCMSAKWRASVKGPMRITMIWLVMMPSYMTSTNTTPMLVPVHCSCRPPGAGRPLRVRRVVIPASVSFKIMLTATVVRALLCMRRLCKIWGETRFMMKTDSLDRKLGLVDRTDTR